MREGSTTELKHSHALPAGALHTTESYLTFRGCNALNGNNEPGGYHGEQIFAAKAQGCPLSEMFEDGLLVARINCVYHCMCHQHQSRSYPAPVQIVSVTAYSHLPA